MQINKPKKENELLNSLKILSAENSIKIDHLSKMFSGSWFNLDEIMLEFDDSKYLWNQYPDNIVRNLNKIDELFDRINENNLHDIEDLNNDLWKQVRKNSKITLELILNWAQL